MQRITGAAPAASPESGPTLAYINEQPGLPISFTAKRGCDQIRARVYHDHRLSSQEALTLLALSEFVNVHTFTAHPKQIRLARMVKTNRTQVNRILHRLEALEVLVIDRHRTYCRYVFSDAWMGFFRPLPHRSRCARDAHQDVRETHITGEPVQRNLYSGSIAAADYPVRAREATARQEQQQQRNQARLEGLLGAVASRARQLGHDFDEADERRRFADGEIDVAALQALADDLEAELADRGDVRHHRITPGLDGGGRCAVCGRRPSSETELCPGRPRRSRIQALAEDCAGAATATRAG